MARQTDIQYVRYYTCGSAAPKVVHTVQENPFYVPTVYKRKKKNIPIDPFAILGIITAVVMLLVMVAGASKLDQVKSERMNMEAYISGLRQEQASMQAEYESGYNLDVVEKTALALGMVPKEQVQTVPVRVLAPESELAEEAPSFWEKVGNYFQGLFA